MMPSMPELIMITIIVILLFGTKRIPQIMRSMGETIKEMRGIGKELDNE